MGKHWVTAEWALLSSRMQGGPRGGIPAAVCSQGSVHYLRYFPALMSLVSLQKSCRPAMRRCGLGRSCLPFQCTPHTDSLATLRTCSKLHSGDSTRYVRTFVPPTYLLLRRCPACRAATAEVLCLLRTLCSSARQLREDGPPPPRPGTKHGHARPQLSTSGWPSAL